MMKRTCIALLTVMLVVLSVSPVVLQSADAQYGISEYSVKTLSDPIGIYTLQDLDNIRNNLNGNYVLMNNIDASATITWDSGAGWSPIGSNSSNRFSGFLDGNNHTISGLFINRSSTSNVGLFGYTTTSAIKNVGLLDSEIRGENYVVGLVGFNSGTITHSYFVGNVSKVGDVSGGLGGLVGFNSGTIDQSYAAGKVSSVGGVSNGMGGLVGRNVGLVNHSYALTNVSSDGVVSGGVGGLVGFNTGTIDQSYAAGKVSSIGRVSSGGVGGGVGGLVGFNTGTIDQSYAAGKVSSIGDVSGGGVGGLVGFNWYYNMVNQSYALGNVSSVGNVSAGSYGGGVGGLVGSNSYGCMIDQSYAVGNVSSNGYIFGGVGGLVGFDHYGTVEQSYALGNVTTNGNVYGGVGGLVGYIYGAKVYRSYSAGSVVGYVINDGGVGGLVGRNYQGWASQSYWDTETSGRFNSAGGMGAMGRTTSEMKQQTTFTNWDFTYVWYVMNGVTYPRLQSTAIIKAITIESSPGHVVYKYGDGLNLSGLTLNLTCYDDSYIVVPWDHSILSITPTNVTPLTHDDSVVTVTHSMSGSSTSFNITINRVVTAIWINQEPQLLYDYGDELNLSSLEVNLQWSDTGNQTIAFADFASKGLTVDPSSILSLNHSHHGLSINVSHTSGHYVHTGNISVDAIVLSVSIEQQPQLIYDYGDALNLSLLQARLNYSNGTYNIVGYKDFISKGLTVDPSSILSLNHSHHGLSINVSHTSGHYVHTGNISVDAIVLSVSIEQQPQLMYDYGDPLNLSLLKVALEWSNGTYATIGYQDFVTNGLITNPINGTFLNHGHNATNITVTHSASGEQANSSSLIIIRTVVAIWVNQQPQLLYDYGDELNLSSLEVNLQWSDTGNQTVGFEEFSANNLVISLDTGTVINGGHDGIKITITHLSSGSIVETDTITISDSQFFYVWLAVIAVIIISSTGLIFWFLRWR